MVDLTWLEGGLNSTALMDSTIQNLMSANPQIGLKPSILLFRILILNRVCVYSTARWRM